MDHFAIYFTALTPWRTAHWDSHFSLQVTGIPHDPTNLRTRIRVQLYDWSASHKFIEITFSLPYNGCSMAHWHTGTLVLACRSQGRSMGQPFRSFPGCRSHRPHPRQQYRCRMTQSLVSDLAYLANRGHDHRPSID